MKNIVLLAATAFVTCAFTTVKAENINNDLAEAGLKGKVKSITTTSFYTETGEPVTAGKKVQLFDVNGNRIADNNEGLPPVQYQCQYNQHGYVTEQQQYDGEEKKKDWRTVYAYDNGGKLSETNRYLAAGPLMQRIVYKYDKDGRNTEQLSYAGDGHQNGRTVLAYNKAGILTEQFEYSDFYGTNSLLLHYAYGSKGNLVSFETYNEEHKVERSGRREELAFDNEGNCTSYKEEVKSHGQHYSITYKMAIEYYK